MPIPIQGYEPSGVNFEERVYNDDGNMVKCIRWNSLDSSTKFYEECEREKDGRVKYDKDETGAYSAMYEYADGTNLVNAVTYPDGGKLAYGRNPYNNQITSVTQSTADGEANTNEIVYENGLPVKVTSGNTTLEYVYDDKGRKTEIKVNGATQNTFSYNDNRDYNPDDGIYTFGGESQTYKTGSGDIRIDRSVQGESGSGALCLTKFIHFGGDVLSETAYDEKGRITDVKDNTAASRVKEIKYNYDSYGKVKNAISTGSTANVIIREDNTYDDYGALQKKTLSGEVTQTYSYAYKNNAARDLNYIAFGGYKFRPLTDVNGRNTGKEIYSGPRKVAAEYITYRKVGDHATNMPATVWFGSGSQIKDSIKYKYDSCGNICEITQNGHVIARYTYDSLNRLIREDNKPLNKTVIYTYDSAGNIIEKCRYAYTEYAIAADTSETGHDSYDYDGDKLVSYKGEACVYNNIGNPTTYRGKVCEWQYATRLTKYGDTTFEYDSLGRRTRKGSITFTYDSDGRLLKQNSGIEFFYDAGGVAGLKYNGVTYFYRKDAQGNIIAVINSNGTVEATYDYDAWGNHKVNLITSNGSLIDEYHIGNLNPFRYRGYYYDKETELYYLQSRYYDPEVGRFISQDSLDYADPETINGLNLYAYCGNNPVMFTDPNGTAKWWQWLLFGIGAAIVVAAAVVLTVATGGAATTLLGAVAVGAAKGALIGAAVGSVVGIAGGAIYAGVTGADMGQSILSGFLMGFGIGAIVGAVVGGFVGYGSYVPTKITGFTNHGLNQIISRNGHGISNQAILDTIKNPQKILKKGRFFKSTYRFDGNKATVVLNKVGKVVTAWARSKLWWRF